MTSTLKSKIFNGNGIMIVEIWQLTEKNLPFWISLTWFGICRWKEKKNSSEKWKFSFEKWKFFLWKMKVLFEKWKWSQLQPCLPRRPSLSIRRHPRRPSQSSLLSLASSFITFCPFSVVANFFRLVIFLNPIKCFLEPISKHLFIGLWETLIPWWWFAFFHQFPQFSPKHKKDKESNKNYKDF